MKASNRLHGLLSRGDEIQELVDRLLRSEVVAVDAEMDSFYSYQTKLCLIQISTNDEDFLVDPLHAEDLSPLREVFESPRILKVLHAADNDVPYLVQRVGGRVGPLFDTHVAARLLGMPRNGLGGLVADMLGKEVDKSHQRADWRRRPLPPDMLQYARDDTHFLIRLWKQLFDQLEERELREEAESAFQRVSQLPPSPRKFNEHGYLSIREARKLSRFHKARLRDLYRWREELSRRLDEAVFRVMPEGLLVPLAQFEGGADELRKQFRHPTVQRHAEAICQVLHRAEATPFVAPVVEPTLPPLRGADFECYERLRKWRNQLAQELGFDTERVLSNRQLKAVVLARPGNPEALAQVPGLEAWRLEKFGALLWAQLTPE